MQIGFVVAEMSLSSHRLPIDIQILNGLSPKEEHVIRILWVSCCYCGLCPQKSTSVILLGIK